jgi:hypothetical protein
VPILKPKKGYIANLLGSERVAYWCPKISALAGGILGFYGVNLGVNLGIYAAQSRLAEAAALNQAAEQLTPFIDNCVTCTVDTTGIDSELAKIIQGNKENNAVLHAAADALTKAAHEAATKPLGAKTALHFAQEAAHGDVPLNFLRIANVAGAALGAAGGYVLGDKLAEWLNSSDT